MLHTLITSIDLAGPVTIPNEVPPGGSKILGVFGWILWACSAACGLGIAKAGASLSTAGAGRGGQAAGEHSVGFVVACIGAVICFSAGAICIYLS